MKIDLDTQTEGNALTVHREPSIQEIVEAAEHIGSLKMLHKVRDVLASEMINGLMIVEEKKFWRIWGYKSFKDYVDSDEVPEYSSTKFYHLRELYLAEGKKCFDLFTDFKIPRTTRKLLLENNVEISIEGDDLLIGGERVPVNDKKAISELIDTFKDTLDSRDRKIEKQKQEIQVREDLFIAESAAERSKAFKLVNLDLDAFQSKYISLTCAFRDLKLEVERMPLEARREWRGKVFKTIALNASTLQNAFGIDRVKKEPDYENMKDLSDKDFIDKLLDVVMTEDIDDELTYQLNQKENDDELTAKLEI